MDISEIQASFGELEIEDDQLMSTFSVYSAATGRKDLQEFAAYLHQHEQIDAKTLKTIITQSKVSVQQLHTVQELEQHKQFHFLGKIGEGAMGEILLAKDNLTHRTTAYKKIKSTLDADAKVMDQFLAEAQITAQLEHPSIVPIYHLDVLADGSIAYTMKFIEGKTFKELIAHARSARQDKRKVDEGYSQARFLEYFLKVCDALDYAHHKGVIHRDLKPANIMIGSYNEVLVMDWGIARLIGGELEPSDKIIGTPLYLSPEQARAKNNQLTGQSDQYALGLILQELVTLKPAYQRAATFNATLIKVLKGQRETLDDSVAPELKAIIEKATQLKPAQRYASVKEMADDLRRYLRGEAVLARPDTPVQKLQRWISQNREKTLALIFGFLILSLGLILYSTYTYQQSMIQTRQHHARLQHGLTLVSSKAQELNEYFLRIEGMVKTLGESTVNALSNPQPSGEKYYLIADSFVPEKQPPDLVWSDAYQMNINVDWSGFIIKYWTNFDQVKASLDRLAPLRHEMKKVMTQSLYLKDQVSSPQAMNQWIIQGKVPIRYVYFGLEEGLFFEVPYQQRNVVVNANYRQAPWYKQAKADGKVRWQAPYATFTGLSNLPCTMPLYDQQKRFLGVLAVRMALEEVESQFIKLEAPGVLETSMIDSTGQILVSSNRPKTPLKKLNKEQLLKFPKITSPWALSALKTQTGGYHIEHTPEGNILYFYSYIKTQGWLYIVKAREANFLANLK